MILKKILISFFRSFEYKSNSRKITAAKPADLFVTHDSDGEEADAPPPPPLEEYYNPGPPPDNVVIGDWIQVFDPTSNVRYYYNKITRKSSWNEPTEVTSFKSEAKRNSGELDPATWTAFTQGNRKYFVNEKTRRRLFIENTFL